VIVSEGAQAVKEHGLVIRVFLK